MNVSFSLLNEEHASQGHGALPIALPEGQLHAAAEVQVACPPRGLYLQNLTTGCPVTHACYFINMIYCWRLPKSTFTQYVKVLNK